MSDTNDQLSTFYDLQNIEKEHRQAMKYVAEIVDTIDKASKKTTLKVNIDTGGGNLADFAKASQTMAASNATVKQSFDLLGYSINKTEELKAKYNGSTKDFVTSSEKVSKVTLNEAKATTESAKQKEIETRVTIALTKEKERLEKQMLKEQTAANKLTNEYEQLKVKSNAAAAEALRLAAAHGVESKEAANAISTARLYNDQLLKIEASIGRHQRNVGNYASATMSVSQMIREAPAFANSVQTGLSALSNNIPILFDNFKQLREQVGSTSKALKIMFGSILGFTNLFILGYAAFEIFGKNLFKSGEAAKKAKEELDQYNQTLKNVEQNAYSSASAEAARLNVLTTIARDVSQSQESRLLAVQALQKEFPRYFQNLDKEVILNGDITDAINGATQALFRKAAATAAMGKYTEASKKEYEAFVKQRDALKSYNDYLGQFGAIGEKYAAAQLKAGETDKMTYDQRKKATDQILQMKGALASAGFDFTKFAELQNNLNQSVKGRFDMRKEMSMYLKDAQDFAKQMGADFFDKILGGSAAAGTIAELQEQIKTLTDKRDNSLKINTTEGVAAARKISAEIEKIQERINYLQGNDPKKKQGKDNALKNEQDLTKEFYEEYAKRMENEAKIDKEIMDNEHSTYDERLEAAKNYYQLTFQAQSARLSAEYTETEQALARIAELEKKNVDDRTDQDKRLIGQKELLQQRLERIIEDANGIELDARRKSSQDILKIQADEVDKRLDMVRHINENVDAIEGQTLEALKKQYESGSISYKEYTHQRQLTEGKFQTARLLLTKEYLQAEAAAMKAMDPTANIQKILDAIATIDAKLGKMPEQPTGKMSFGLTSEQFQQTQQINDKLIEMEQLLADTVNKRYQKELDLLDEKKKRIDDNAAAEIAAVQNGQYSEEEKAKKIAVIKAQADAQDKQIEREQAAIKQRQAQANKAAAIAAIIQGTAIAVVAALGSQPFTPFNIGMATAVGILGAGRLAAAIATEVPQYAEGTPEGGHPADGPALIGELYKPEVVIEPGKAPYVVNKPTYKMLKAGTHVIPQEKMIQDVAAIGGMHTSGLLQQLQVNNNTDTSALEQVTKEGFNRMEGALKSIPQTQFIATGGEFQKVVRKRGQATIFINKHMA